MRVFSWRSSESGCADGEDEMVDEDDPLTFRTKSNTHLRNQSGTSLEPVSLLTSSLLTSSLFTSSPPPPNSPDEYGHAHVLTVLVDVSPRVPDHLPLDVRQRLGALWTVLAVHVPPLHRQQRRWRWRGCRRRRRLPVRHPSAPQQPGGSQEGSGKVGGEGRGERDGELRPHGGSWERDGGEKEQRGGGEERTRGWKQRRAGSSARTRSKKTQNEARKSPSGAPNSPCCSSPQLKLIPLTFGLCSSPPFTLSFPVSPREEDRSYSVVILSL